VEPVEDLIEERIEEEESWAALAMRLAFFLVLVILGIGTAAAFVLVVGGLAMTSGSANAAAIPTVSRPVLEARNVRRPAADALATAQPLSGTRDDRGAVAGVAQPHPEGTRVDLPTVTPTATAVPTDTPTPTLEPAPTATPLPTETARPIQEERPIATPVPSPRPAPEPAPSSRRVVVAEGESLTSIAAVSGISVASLAAANGLSSDAQLLAGQSLVVPSASGVVHTVAEGESLSAIAAAYGVSVASLMETNGLADAERIFAGQRLTVRAPR